MDFQDVAKNISIYTTNVEETEKNINNIKKEITRLENERFRKIYNCFSSMQDMAKNAGIPEDKILCCLPFDCIGKEGGQITKISLSRFSTGVGINFYRSNPTILDEHPEMVFARSAPCCSVSITGDYRYTLRLAAKSKYFFETLYLEWEKYEPIIMRSFNSAMQFHLEEKIQQLNQTAQETMEKLKKVQKIVGGKI